MTSKEIEKNSGWDDWAVKTQKSFMIGDKNFTVQSIPGEEFEEISEIFMPIPPQKLKKDERGKPIILKGAAQMEEDLEDPVYIKQVEEATIKRMLLILKHGLVTPDGGNIPGQTEVEKWNYLKKGSMGVIEKVTSEILKISSLQPGDVDDLKEI